MDSMKDHSGKSTGKNVDKSAGLTACSEFLELELLAKGEDPVRAIINRLSAGAEAGGAEAGAEVGEHRNLLDALVFDDKLKGQIAEAGCIVPLIEKLGSPASNEQCKAFVAGYLASLALSADIRREITMTAATPLLVDLARHSISTGAQEMATLSLFVLAENADARRQICNHHGVRTLLNLSISDVSSNLCKEHCKRTLDCILRDPALTYHIRNANAQYDLT